ncbi:MHYT domain-containing protein [Cryptosporangium aurantiacum]|uniref:MHYT domain-containing protein n=1 Tax=Cryptosporangium aurantiacum TaxID=134849 RepID=UPI001C49EC0A|nr:MHYT domain-containing protein [Cryptosporangium aurantiacum]
MSVLGSLLGLVCTARGRQARTAAKRFGWLTLSAVSIGGTGIWMMHFLAMLGFSVEGSDVRYSVAQTVLSALLAVVVVGIGLLILGTGQLRWWRVLAGGLFAGLGVAGMHYTGMAAMRLNGTVGYDSKLVALSLVIAVVAASAALWFTVVARNLWLITGAALIMGVAVNGMHYVGMAASRVTLDNTHSAADGVDVTTALPVIAGLAGIIVVVLLYSALSTPIDEDARTRESRRQSRPQPSEGDSFWTPRTAAGAGTGTGTGVHWSAEAPERQPQPQWAGPGSGPEWPAQPPVDGDPGPSRWAALRQQPGADQQGSSPWAADSSDGGRNGSSSW